jgi:CheY-like chemotaxis protein
MDVERSTGRRSSRSSSADGSPQKYFLLNDQPVDQVGDDPLGMTDVATGIASVLVASMRSSPFVLAVDAGWGMGKSTLLRQIENRLPDSQEIIKLRFNAWTAEGENALEGLIKAVLGELDRNVLRRWVRRLARRRHLVGIAWLTFGLAARFFGVARLVDELWRQMGGDAKSRNEFRDLIHDMLSDWVSTTGEADPARALVVFIDDLDRCSDDVIVKICEAVKLYLDARGLIFVMACDQSVLARGVALSARGGTGEGRAYLEKIVQVAYRMPPPEEDQIRRLIQEYARKSGTADLIDNTIADILAEGTGRNPRRIKRIINSFVLEYRLDPAWKQPPLSSSKYSEIVWSPGASAQVSGKMMRHLPQYFRIVTSSMQLVSAIILQHLHAPFYELLVSEETGEDPIGQFLDYVQIRERLPEPPPDGDPWWEIIRRCFKAYRIHAPESSSVDAEKLGDRLKELEGKLPGSFTDLADNKSFVALLQGVQKSGASEALRAQLVRRPLATVSEHEVPSFEVTRTLAGWRVICVDDNPDSIGALVHMLEGLGASVRVYSSPAESDVHVQHWKPHVVISDITRGADRDAGFKHIAQLRESGYDGLVLFFTGRVTPERLQRADELGALGVVTTEGAVLDVIRKYQRIPPGAWFPSGPPPD